MAGIEHLPGLLFAAIVFVGLPLVWLAMHRAAVSRSGFHRLARPTTGIERSATEVIPRQYCRFRALSSVYNVTVTVTPSGIILTPPITCLWWWAPKFVAWSSLRLEERKLVAARENVGIVVWPYLVKRLADAQKRFAPAT